MMTNPTNLRDVGDAVAATLGRPLTDLETQELSRTLTALGVRQNPAFSQIVGVLMTMRWKLETAGKDIVAAAASAERTAVAHRDAAVAETSREIGKALDVRAITAKIVGAAAAACLVVSVVAGVALYRLTDRLGETAAEGAKQAFVGKINEHLTELSEVVQRAKSEGDELSRLVSAIRDVPFVPSPANKAAMKSAMTALSSRVRTDSEWRQIEVLVSGQEVCLAGWEDASTTTGMIHPVGSGRPEVPPRTAPNGTPCQAPSDYDARLRR